MNKVKRKKRFNSMSSSESQKFILKKMKAKEIKVGSGVLNKNYNIEEINELNQIANCFPELRD